MQKPSTEAEAAIAYLRSTPAIRERCGRLFDLACSDRLQHFRCDLTRLDAVADYVIAVMGQNYPDLQIPFHSRWRHFAVGRVDRGALLQSQIQASQIQAVSPIEWARIKFDLVITSVLLDAGAGALWQYTETTTGQVFARSEGLAVASFHLFLAGTFSSNPDYPWQADAIGLQRLSQDAFCCGFQVSDRNPLVGVAGRLNLMHQLGNVVAHNPMFASHSSDSPPRLGHLVDYLLSLSQENCGKKNQLDAEQIFVAVLTGLSQIWTGRIELAGVNLGDVWVHSALPDRGLGYQLVPFHKLSQWLTYSLLEPLQELGLEIVNLEALTGLSEYRNGGLCLDLGLLQPKHAAVTRQAYAPDSEVIVEWRALTVILLDRLADLIRTKLGLSVVEFPLVKVLEGGTWSAGRKIAAELRSNGAPPIQVVSDGTVF